MEKIKADVLEHYNRGQVGCHRCGGQRDLMVVSIRQLKQGAMGLPRKQYLNIQEAGYPKENKVICLDCWFQRFEKKRKQQKLYKSVRKWLRERRGVFGYYDIISELSLPPEKRNSLHKCLFDLKKKGEIKLATGHSQACFTRVVKPVTIFGNRY